MSEVTDRAIDTAGIGLPMPDVALVHDYLTQRGGAERVVLALADAFPGAPIHTSLYAPRATFPGFDQDRIRAMGLNRITGLRRDHRRAFPLLAPAFTARRIEADVVVCSSSGWAHGVRTSGRKVVYCYTPARWLYQPERYLRGHGWAARVAGRLLGPWLRPWDRHRAATADRYVAISGVVRDRIRARYGIDAEVIHPPHGMDPSATREPVPGVEPPYWLTIARLLAYKNVDVIVEAFRRLDDRRLVVVGDGPRLEALRSRAPDRVSILGTVPNPQLRWLYANCAATVAASHEDFGLTPLEAAAFGKPTVAVDWAGYRETIVDGKTGVLVDGPAPESLIAGVERLEALAPAAGTLQAHAAEFSRQSFMERMRGVIAEVADGS